MVHKALCPSAEGSFHREPCEIPLVTFVIKISQINSLPCGKIFKLKLKQQQSWNQK